MSALGQKQTCAVHKAMSALCQKRTCSVCHDCPLQTRQLLYKKSGPRTP